MRNGLTNKLFNKKFNQKINDIMDTIAGFVYYYYDLNPDDIVSIGTYSPYGFPQIYIHNSLFQNIGKADILLTPTAYINWYNNNLSSIQNSKNYAYIEQDFTFFDLQDTNNKVADYLLSIGAYWVRYSGDYASLYTLGSNVIDPVKTYGLTSNELYMLIVPNTKSDLQDINISTTQQQAQIGTSIQAIDNSQIQNEVSSALTSASKSIGNAVNISNPIFDISAVLIGLIALAIILK